MTALQVTGGSFPIGRVEFMWGVIAFPKRPKDGFDKPVSLDLRKELATVEPLHTSSASSTRDIAGSGIAGGLLFGGAGAIIGGLLGATKKQSSSVMFRATMTDGRWFVAEAQEGVFKKLLGMASGIPAAASSTDPLLDSLERLAVLKEKGLLSDQEFSEQKSRLLNGSAMP